VTSQSEKELQAGISIFVEMCSNVGLTCAPISSPHPGSPARFELSNGDKELHVRVGYEFLTDLPGTKEFQSALWFYLSAVALKLPEQNFGEYATLSGIPITFAIEFPFARSTEGGDYQFVHVHTKSGGDSAVEANFSVHLTHSVAINIASLEFIITEPLVINAVRRFVDAKEAVFYPDEKHPLDLQVVNIDTSTYDYKTKRFVFQKATDDEIAAFLKRKVYWLGFRRGNQGTRVCIADSYDAQYLGVSRERLQQSAAILAANGFVQLDPSGVFASAGANLLLEARSLDKERDAFLKVSPLVAELAERPSRTATPEVVPVSDVFVSHATEDKGYVEPLVKALEDAGIRVWFDKSALEWGDDLRAAIDRGLTNCRYGIVVFSQAFLRKKKWTEYELNSLFAREQAGKKLILPIWHGITRDDLMQYSPGFADRLAKISSTDSYADIVQSLLRMLGRSSSEKELDRSIRSTSARKSGGVKPNAVAYALYETKGGNALRAEAYVRPSGRGDGYFTFESSFGEEEHGTMEQIAQRFIAFDRNLTMKGFIRMQHGNSGDRAFNL
jgi:hypothetical protein